MQKLFNNSVRLVLSRYGPPDEYDPSDCGTYLYRARLRPGPDADKIVKAIRSYFTPRPCHHEYDCCGCQCGYVVIKKLNKRDLSIRFESRRNY